MSLTKAAATETHATQSHLISLLHFGSSSNLTTHLTLTSKVKFFNFYPFNDFGTISSHPLLFVSGIQAHSREFSEHAHATAAEPKQLIWMSELVTSVFTIGLT